MQAHAAPLAGLRRAGGVTGRVNRCGTCRLPKRTECMCRKDDSVIVRQIGQIEQAAPLNTANTELVNPIGPTVAQDVDYGSDCDGEGIDTTEDVILYDRNDILVNGEAENDREDDAEEVMQVDFDHYNPVMIEIMKVETPTLRSSDIDFDSRRHYPPFRGLTRLIHPGPKNIPPRAKSPINFFDLLWSDHIMDTFIVNTNQYAVNIGKARWKDVTKKELYGFFAIVLFSGMCRIPIRRQYWDTTDNKFYSKFVHQIMTRSRFEAILSCLHWTDTSMLSPAVKQARNQEDCFWRLSSFMDILCQNFRDHWQCHQNMDVDEQGIPAKCYHSAIQYNGDKPYKWFFKIYALNDSETGYLHNFFAFRGAQRHRADVSASAAPVVLLTEPVEYHDKNHVMWLDNYFTGMKLFNLLMTIGIHAAGTVRTNRIPSILIPKNWYFPKKTGGRNAPLRGSSKCMKLNDQLYVYTWLDKRPVNMISTFPCEQMVVKRWFKDKRTRTATQIEVDRPLIIRWYNAAMGGTDSFDQWLSYYRCDISSKKWPHRFYFHFLVCCVINAYIIHKSVHGLKKHSKFHDLFSFLNNIVDELAARSTTPDDTDMDNDAVQPEYRPLKRLRKVTAFESEVRLKGNQHFPFSLPNRDPITGKDTRGKCAHCNRTVSTFCKTCKIALCISVKAGTTCWEAFHAPCPKMYEV